MRFALASLLSWEPSGFFCFPEKCRQKYSSYGCVGGFPCLLLAPVWTSTHPRAAVLCCSLPCRESVCELCVDEPCSGCLSSHDGNLSRVLLSRMCHGVPILGNSCTKDSLKIAACIESGTVFGSAREMEAGLPFSTGMMSSAHPWSCSHAKPPPYLQRPSHPDFVESSRLPQTWAWNSVTLHLLTLGKDCHLQKAVSQYLFI